MVRSAWLYLKRQPRSILLRAKRHWLTFAFIAGIMVLGSILMKSDWARALAPPTTTEEFWLAGTALINVMLLGAALHGLQSLRLTRARMLHQARRDARECAIKRCEEFAAEIIPKNGPIVNAFAAHKVPVFVKNPSDVRFDPDNTADVERAIGWYRNLAPAVSTECHKLLNRLEAWAMYFTHGLADSDVAFGPLAPYYCSRIVQLYPILLISRNRDENSGQYPNVVSLYKAWIAELEHQKRGLKEGNLLKELRELQAKGSPSYKLEEPLGTQLEH